jgi:sugar O-acyltransferase (sialic acid O-acetyltransferase NeuD family)
VNALAKIVIFGAGDIARLAHFYFSRDSEHTVVAFTVDGAYRNSESFRELPLVDFETVAQTYPPGEYKMFVALSYAEMNQRRADKYHAAKALGYELVSYVSSHCTLLAQNPIGDNCFILEDNTIQPFVTIGSNVTLWSGNHIGHDSTIGDHCFISSHVVISGHVDVGEFCFIGVNATLRNSIQIAPKTLIGAGAVIMKDTQASGVYLPKRSELFSKPSSEILL